MKLTEDNKYYPFYNWRACKWFIKIGQSYVLINPGQYLMFNTELEAKQWIISKHNKEVSIESPKG